MSERTPVYARLLGLVEQSLAGDLGAALEKLWAQREFLAYYERPNLLLAALRYSALIEGPAHPLYAAVVHDPPDLDAVTPSALAGAIAPARGDFWQAVATRGMQTNETTRAVAWMWPAHLLARAGVTRPLALVDLGASAGLNLIADRLPIPWTDELGSPLELTPRPVVRVRLGLDRAPVDVRGEDGVLWLRACVWAGDRAREERLELAIAEFGARAGGDDGPRLEACNLVDAPARLQAIDESLTVLAFQTIVRDYLSTKDLERYENGMRAWLAGRPPLTALWAELELEEQQRPPEQSAAVAVHFCDSQGDVRHLVLARTHPHPRQLLRDRQAVDGFVRAFAAGGAGA